LLASSTSESPQYTRKIYVVDEILAPVLQVPTQKELVDTGSLTRSNSADLPNKTNKTKQDEQNRSLIQHQVQQKPSAAIHQAYLSYVLSWAVETNACAWPRVLL
jgi:hypothetical protein